MNNSGYRMMSTPGAASRAARTFAAFPTISPTTGLSWARAIERRSGGGFMPNVYAAAASFAMLAEPANEPLPDRKEPCGTRHQQRKPDRGRSHILDALDDRIMFHRHAIGEFLDRGIQQFHDHDRDH